MANLHLVLLYFVTFAVTYQCEAAFYDCMHNDDCADENLCCSYTPALGRRQIQGRQIPPNWDGMVHYCLPWKNENATWCSLNLQYSETAPHYMGLCPCGPGLKCTPTHDLDPNYYPRDRYGKCTHETAL